VTKNYKVLKKKLEKQNRLHW